MDREKREKYIERLKRGILAECVLVLAIAMPVIGRREESAAEKSTSSHVLSIENDYIKWVDFTVSYEALCTAYEWDVETHGSEHEIDWVELLAYTAARTGGEFDREALKTMDRAAEKLSSGEKSMEEMTEDLKYYAYYKEAYDAAIGGLVGEYWEAVPTAGEARPEGNSGGEADESTESAAEDGSGAEAGENDARTEVRNTDNLAADGIKEKEPGNTAASHEDGYVKKYGLKGYFPLARGFDYTHYDDFGVGRSYGYQRKHLG